MPYENFTSTYSELHFVSIALEDLWPTYASSIFWERNGVATVVNPNFHDVARRKGMEEQGICEWQVSWFCADNGRVA